MPNLTSTIVIVHEEAPVGPLIRWAARIAASRSSTLQVLCCVTGEPDGQVVPMTRRSARREAGFIRTAVETLDDMGGRDAQILLLRHSNPSLAVLDYVQSTQIEIALIGAVQRPERGAARMPLGERLRRFAPCDVVTMDVGDTDGRTCDRVIVPMVGPLSAFALKSALGLVRDSGVVQAAMVGADIGSDAEELARTTLDLELREAGVRMTGAIEPVVMLAEDEFEGYVELGGSGDLVLIGGTSPRILDRYRATERVLAPDDDRERPAVAVIRPARVRRATPWLTAAARAEAWLPTLLPADRIDLFERLHAGARWNADFAVMIGLSTAIATLGLLLGSPAVVIGAMLVAPLMTPLIAAGLALVQGNLRLFTMACRTMALGVVTGFGLSVLLTFAAPDDLLTLEVMARGTPTILDMPVALLSGMAAAYAMARPNVIAALAGVAIAAALVPPLASVGIALIQVHPKVAEGAAILLVTNLVAIILGAALIFRWLGVRGARPGAGPILWGRRTILALILLSALLTAPLGFDTARAIREGQIRPQAYPLSPRVSQAVLARVRQEPDIREVLAGRRGIDLAGVPDVFIVLSASGPVPKGLQDDVAGIVREMRGEDLEVDVQVLTRLQCAE